MTGIQREVGAPSPSPTGSKQPGNNARRQRGKRTKTEKNRRVSQEETLEETEPGVKAEFQKPASHLCLPLNSASGAWAGTCSQPVPNWRPTGSPSAFCPGSPCSAAPNSLVLKLRNVMKCRHEALRGLILDKDSMVEFLVPAEGARRPPLEGNLCNNGDAQKEAKEKTGRGTAVSPHHPEDPICQQVTSPSVPHNDTSEELPRRAPGWLSWLNADSWFWLRS